MFLFSPLYHAHGLEIDGAKSINISDLGAGSVAQVVEHFSTMCEALSLIPSIAFKRVHI